MGPESVGLGHLVSEDRGMSNIKAGDLVMVVRLPEDAQEPREVTA